MDEPLISIVIPVYKVEKYIHRCIDSVLNQTYKNLEIILVDDGSPDNCGIICDEYSQKYERIKVIHKKNGGLSDARNVGLNTISGEYIGFIDSDDWIENGYIEKLYRLINKYNADISVCNFIKTSCKDKNLDCNLKVEIKEYTNIQALEQYYDIYSIQMVVAWGKLYKRSLFKDIEFPIGKIHEDEYITYKLFYRSNKVVLTTEPLYYYWQRSDSIMGLGFNIKGQIDAIDAFEERARFFKKVGLENLSGKTYKTVFFMYLVLLEYVNRFENKINKNEIAKRFKCLKGGLKNSKQKFMFKAFYELYYILPGLMELVYKVYKSVK